MLHARIIVLALVAILITAGVAVALGTVGREAGADGHLLSVRDTGIVERRPGGMCVYLLSLDDNRHPEVRQNFENGRYELRRALSGVGHTFQHGGTIQAGGRIEIGGGYDYIIMPTDDYGRDTYFHGLPTRAEAAIGTWYWDVFLYRSSTRRYAGKFNGPYAEDLHEALLKCANAIAYPPTPTPSPTPIATATPIPEPTATPTATATPLPTATAVVSPPAVIPGPATPTPTATPRTNPALTQPTATPSASPTATPESDGDDGDDPQSDTAALIEAIRALVEVLTLWINSQTQN